MQYSGNCRGSRDGLQVASAQGAQAAFESARRGLATADGAVTRCLCRMFRGDSDQWPGGALQAFWKQHVGCAGAPGDWECAAGVKIFPLGSGWRSARWGLWGSGLALTLAQ